MNYPLCITCFWLKFSRVSLIEKRQIFFKDNIKVNTTRRYQKKELFAEFWQKFDSSHVKHASCSGRLWLFREFNLNPMKLLAITGVGFRIYMYFLFYLFLCLHQSGMFSHSTWDLALWPGIEPGPLVLGAPSQPLDHQGTPSIIFDPGLLPVPRLLPRY